ncbi:MAG: hypothetical protein CBB68_07065 [Rhodospirillaceae bacterium TMED8]|nr:hypothetical protein [Magnetovibrio sp.]OUT50754.1 MAG: hypothetical protein CBB68_07065 [Rhodospirillaceae bacterium TMED8]
MKVCVSVHGRFHAFELAAGLHRNGALSKLLTTYPDCAVRQICGEALPMKGAWWLEAKRRIGIFGGRNPVAISMAYAKFAAKRLPESADILTGWSSATLEAIEPARSLGMKVIIERGSSHIVHQTHVLECAYAAEGLKYIGTPMEIIQREEIEYAEADFISVPSKFAANTFIDRGIASSKLLVNPYGVDLLKFQPAERIPSSRPPRILFVGRVGIRKGVPDLIRAFSRLSGTAELRLVGPVENEMRDILARLPMEHVSVVGPIPYHSLHSEYEQADVFCLPSWEEGVPLVLLQAMASGLPVIATKECGVEDIFLDGYEGFLVEKGNVEGLREALVLLCKSLGTRQKLGAAARVRMEKGCAWHAYVTRTLEHYRGVLC